MSGRAHLSTAFLSAQNGSPKIWTHKRFFLPSLTRHFFLRRQGKAAGKGKSLCPLLSFSLLAPSPGILWSSSLSFHAHNIIDITSSFISLPLSLARLLTHTLLRIEAAAKTTSRSLTQNKEARHSSGGPVSGAAAAAVVTERPALVCECVHRAPSAMGAAANSHARALLGTSGARRQARSRHIYISLSCLPFSCCCRERPVVFLYLSPL